MTAPAVPAVPAVSTARTSDRLLAAGALAGPVFAASAVIQMVTRTGFDIARHPISQLSTGGLGWIQMATFVLAGLGGLALAAGIRRTLRAGFGRRALPVCVGIFGVGLITAGLFPMDPENGFPVGTPDRPVAEMSWHSVAHSASAAIAFTALAVAAIALTVRCAPPCGTACRTARRRRARPGPAHVAGPHEYPDRRERSGRFHLDNRRRDVPAAHPLNRPTITRTGSEGKPR